jgi:Mlc titration factor MtfA (ptsG expression regulator)
MAGLFKSLRAWSDARTLKRRPIPDELWAMTVARYPFISCLDAAPLERLRQHATLFLAGKEFSGAGGLEVTDAMAVAVAAQACLPVLELGIEAYDSFVGIVMHPSEVVVEREFMDEDGIVHVEEQTLSGEVMQGGPMMLAWEDVDVAGESADWGYNVVIHEFAHVLDMRNGRADGIPALPDRATHDRWEAVMTEAYEEFCERVEDGFDTVIDPYGATAVDEFFAVSAEAFFVAPGAMKIEQPQVYALLAEYFKQDPAKRLP